MAEPKVTICISHLMRRKLLRKCLGSLENVRIPYKLFIFSQDKERLNIPNAKILYSDVRVSNGMKKQILKDSTETEYMFKLDNDVLVLPQAIELQIEAMDKNPDLGIISGLRYEGNILRRYPGVVDFEFDGNKLIKKHFGVNMILNSPHDIFYADFVPLAYTMFRMRALKDVKFDTEYQMGYSHIDIALQFRKSKWKSAVHKKSMFVHIKDQSPQEYFRWRQKVSPQLIRESKKHFVEKWGLEVIERK